MVESFRTTLRVEGFKRPLKWFSKPGGAFNARPGAKGRRGSDERLALDVTQTPQLREVHVIERTQTCVLINIGLFMFAELYPVPYLQLLALFNIASFLVYFLISGRK